MRLILNNSHSNVQAELEALAMNADKINVAVAFLSDAQWIRRWVEEDKRISIIVSLRPPTNYYALKAIQAMLPVNAYFLGSHFHSKFWVFYKRNSPFACLLGSSNFSAGGLSDNTEANIIIGDKRLLAEIDKHFNNELLPASKRLQPTDLDQYKSVYLAFLKRNAAAVKELTRFSTKVIAANTATTIHPCKEARQYFEFWRAVDIVKDVLVPLIDQNFPDDEYYFVLDHFWHYIKAVWHRESGRYIKPSDANSQTTMLFKQFIKWRKNREDNGYSPWMRQQSTTVFQKFLSIGNIDRLTKEQALKIYQTLHSSAMPIQRFGSDYIFIKWNTIGRIRRSFKYLVHSNDSIDVKIHNMLKHPDYKLHRLAASGIQEINGWMYPDKMPIRNRKADEALYILGYRFSELQ